MRSDGKTFNGLRLKVPKYTSAEDSKKFFVSGGQLQDFQYNSGEAMDQNSTAIKYKILTKHGYNFPCLRNKGKINSFPTDIKTQNFSFPQINN